MMDTERNRVCPVELAGSLDNRIRRWIQDPRKILGPYVRPGMTVLDIGCGPGFFSVEIAQMVGPEGKVISADLQDGMLKKLGAKISGSALEPRIQLVKCASDSINVSAKVDLVLAFYMVHEVPDKARFFRELGIVLKDSGQLLLIEPRLFHVTRKEFADTLSIAAGKGFRVTDRLTLPFSWGAVLVHDASRNLAP